MLEDVLLTLAAYALFVAWHAGWITYSIFLVGMIIAVFRVFNIRHERAHLPHSSHSKLRTFLTTVCWVFHTPYQEPYLDKRRKHLAHHKGHLIARPLTTAENPHELLEQKSFVKSIFTAIFYEEVMFYQDWKFNKGLSASRRQMIPIATLVIIGLWLVFGAVSMIGLILTYRLCMALAWFSFSKMLHLKLFYGEPLLERLPVSVSRGVELLLGSGAATALLAHEFHHRVPLKFHQVLGKIETKVENLSRAESA